MTPNLGKLGSLVPRAGVSLLVLHTHTHKKRRRRGEYIHVELTNQNFKIGTSFGNIARYDWHRLSHLDIILWNLGTLLLGRAKWEEGESQQRSTNKEGVHGVCVVLLFASPHIKFDAVFSARRAQTPVLITSLPCELKSLDCRNIMPEVYLAYV